MILYPETTQSRVIELRGFAWAELGWVKVTVAMQPVKEPEQRYCYITSDDAIDISGATAVGNYKITSLYEKLFLTLLFYKLLRFLNQ